jgi:hypothetical protein
LRPTFAKGRSVFWLAVCVALLVTAAATASGAKRPAHMWTQAGPWGDASDDGARNGIEFWKPRARWGVGIDDTGDLFVRFSKVQWRGWGTATVVATALLEECYAEGPQCEKPVHVRLVLSRPVRMDCGDEDLGGGVLVYTRYQLTGYRPLAGVRRSTRVC